MPEKMSDREELMYLLCRCQSFVPGLFFRGGNRAFLLPIKRRVFVGNNAYLLRLIDHYF